MRSLTLLFLLTSILSIAQKTIAPSADTLQEQLKVTKGAKRITILNTLFGTYINQDPVKATGYAKEALTLAMEFEDNNGMAAAYNNIGVAYKNHGAFEQALENYLTAESIYTKVGNKDGAAATHNNIGTIYSLRKDFEKSKKYFQESLKTFTELKDSIRMIVAMNNLGNVFSDLGNYPEALALFNQSIEISNRLKKTITDPMVNLGNVYIRQNKSKEAIEFLNKAAIQAMGDRDQLSIMTIKNSLANAHLRNEDFRSAEKELREALDICNKLEAYYFKPQILRNLAETYAKLNKPADAYRLMLQYDESKEIIYSEESSRRIAQMEMVIDIHAKEKQIEALKKDEELKSVQLQRTQLGITVVVISLLAIALGVNAFLQSSKRKKKK